jgi:hypothetical protein
MNVVYEGWVYMNVDCKMLYSLAETKDSTQLAKYMGPTWVFHGQIGNHLAHLLPMWALYGQNGMDFGQLGTKWGNWYGFWLSGAQMG